MKKILLSFCLMLMVFCTSCKYDLTCAGTYSGTFSNSLPGFPVDNGTATVVMTEIGKNNYDLVISSAGNPDMTINDISGDPFCSLDGAVFSMSHVNGSVTIYENDTYNSVNPKWTISVYYNDANGSVSFTGNRL